MMGYEQPNTESGIAVGLLSNLKHQEFELVYTMLGRPLSRCKTS